MAEDSTGYNQTGEETKKIPEPQTRNWEVKLDKLSDPGDDTVYGKVMLDGNTIGLLRLPNGDHLRWLRETLKSGKE